MEKFDVSIIGAGSIGGAVAYKLSQQGYKVAVIDKELHQNKHQTGRNSGVIHSGVYYPKNSLKSKTCLDGYGQLISFLKKFDLPYKITGKLIAAADESEYPELDRLYKNAKEVGLNVDFFNAEQIREIDENLISKRGFFVKETGITDYKKVLDKFIELSRKNGAEFFFGSEVKTITKTENFTQVETKRQKFKTKQIINCAGLQADRVYSLLTKEKPPVKIVPFKGEYFHVKPKAYNSDIPVYPVPNPNFPFLGVHLTKMIDGTLKVGPNAVLSFSQEGYEGVEINLKDSAETFTNKALFNIARRYSKTVTKELLKQGSKKYFKKNVRKYWSKFVLKLINGYSCGIRAQATADGELIKDFWIETFENQVHVLNAPSPAATSCLAIADTVIEKL